MKPTANETQIGGDHYRTDSGVQVWDFIDQNNIPYLEGNFIKYVFRHRKKGGVKDLEKARHYLQKIMERTNAGNRLVLLQNALHLFVLQHNIPMDERRILMLLFSANFEKALHELNDLIAQAQEQGD